MPFRGWKLGSGAGDQADGSGFEHDFPRGLLAAVQGVGRDEFAVEVEPPDELAGGGNFVALVGHEFAAEVVLGGRGDGGHDVVAAGVLGCLPSMATVSSSGRGPRMRRCHFAVVGAARHGGGFDGGEGGFDRAAAGSGSC